MKCNLRGSDDYLAEWHKAEPYIIEGDPDTVAEVRQNELRQNTVKKTEISYRKRRLEVIFSRANDTFKL